MTKTGRVLVLYGSQTFTAQEIAERIWRSTKILGFRGPVQALDDYPISRLIHEEFIIFVCATTGQGDEPDNMKKFWKFLLRKNLPSNSLVRVKFGVLGLGDSTYLKFNFTAKKLHKRLIQLGATPLINVGLCDYQHDLGHDAVMIPWVKEYFSELNIFFPNIQMDSLKTKFISRWKVSLLKNNDNEKLLKEGISEDIYFSNNKTYDCIQALHMELDKNIRTTSDNHIQDVRLLTFKTAGNIILDYKPGDIFNVRPRNCKEDINELFDIFRSHNMDIEPHYRLLVETCHEDMPVPEFLQTPLSLYQIAEQYWDLKFYPTQYVFSLLAMVSDDKLERDKCIELSSPEGQEDWLNYCRRPKRTIIEVLQDFHKTTSKLTIDVLFELFSPIKPRSFSIASSCVEHCTSVELLLAVVKYNTKLKKPRSGLASNWLKDLKSGDRVFGWIKKGTFMFPDDADTPIIMIGPGTGLAPFRSLLHERIAQSLANKQTLHLFFGCRYKEKDFHCREELEKMVADDHLTLYCAFSRDQEDKIYVQHKIKENNDIMWQLIDKNAYIYISGNAKSMPDCVRDALVEDVMSKVGGLTVEESRRTLENMENNGRLHVETW